MQSLKNKPAPYSILALAIALCGSSSVLAGPANKVYLPVVVKGETEIELRGGYRDFDGGADEYAYVLDLGYAPTDRWKTELVTEYSGETGIDSSFEAVEWENLIVLTEQGEQWADVGLLIEYEHSFADGPDEFKLGPLFMKEIGPTQAVLNLIFETEVGSGASNDVELGYAWEVKWRGKEALEWGVQGFGGAGAVDDLFGDGDQHSIGPALFGVKRMAGGNKLSYDAALLVGLNDSAPDMTIRFELEYEIY